MVIHVRATYRVQLTPTFDLDQAAAMVPYLARLGISHLYTSPLAEATPGSTHGYDVTDPGRVRAELGGERALRRLWKALDAADMGHVVDLVPNHMGIRDPSNRWWQDVLRHGEASSFAEHFDIDWSPPDTGSAGRSCCRSSTAPSPTPCATARSWSSGAPTPSTSWSATTATGGRSRRRRSPCSTWAPATAPSGSTACSRASGGRRPRSRELLAAQHWRAVHWREAPRLLNWRRFFDVTDLAALRVDRPPVFDDVHALLGSWLADDLGARVVQGVRIDHVDGLVDPEGYLGRLRELVGTDRLVVVEKILAASERLPTSWPVDGTTGYDALARLDEALTDPVGAPELRRRVAAATGLDDDWPALERRCRRLVADRLLAPEVGRATSALIDALGPATPTSEPDAAAVVTGLAVELGVYRTYARPGSAPVDAADREELTRAAAALVARRPDLDPTLVDATRALMTHDGGTGPGVDDLVARFAQLTAPLAAKAVEDTAFYRDPTLPWLTEVGGDPGRTAVPLDDVHAAFTTLTLDHHGTLVPLTTHDTKRSGDVRARLSRLAADAGTDDRGLHPLAGPRRAPPLPFRPRAGSRVAGLDLARSAPGPSTPTGWPPSPSRRSAKPRTAPRGSTPMPPTRTRWSGSSAACWPIRPPSARSRRWSPPCSPRAGRRRWRSSPSPAPLGATPTSTRATRPGTWHWSTPTTAARSAPTTSPRCSTGPPTPTSTWPTGGPATPTTRPTTAW